jgi:UDP:flavonoid glycosyltransferase YjiC (YdhE family)
MAEALRQMREDAAMREKAAALGEAIRSEQGTRTAVDLLLETFGR